MLLDRVELTESGGAIEYITVINEGDAEADLSGFTLQVQDRETGDANDSGGRVESHANMRLDPGAQASVGRHLRVKDADGREVIGTFSKGESLTLRAKDQVALLDNGGAVVDTITI